MERSKAVFAEVSKLYATAPTTMGKWMWHNHTQWVANKAGQLAEKYGASTEEAYCAALLHDIGDSRLERSDANFDTWSWETGKKILKKAAFQEDEAAAIMEAIRTHSCRPNQPPTSLEGKILATADGLWHLKTSFFPVICYMNRPDTTTSYEEWQEWFRGKIERDFNAKLFFDDEKEEAKADYDALSRVFKNEPFAYSDE